MASRGFKGLRNLWTTYQRGSHQFEGRRSCFQQARSFSTSKLSSELAIPFSAQWRACSPQLMYFSPNSRAFSAQAAPKDSAAAAASGDTAAVKKKRRKKKTFIEVAQFLPNWGLGARFTKSHWPPGNFYKVTKVKVYKSGRHGRAWGIFHQDEAAKTGEIQKIGGVNKRCWRYVPDVDPTAIVWKRSADMPPIKPVPLTLADTR